MLQSFSNSEEDYNDTNKKIRLFKEAIIDPDIQSFRRSMSTTNPNNDRNRL